MKKLYSLLFILCLTISSASATTWEKVNLENISATDTIIIVDETSGMALAQNGTQKAPTATKVISGSSVDNTLITDNMLFNLGGNASDGYIFYGVCSTTNWLYVYNNNNGLRYGTNTNNNKFKVYTSGTYSGLKANDGTNDRAIGIYNSADWRCYKTSTTLDNIKTTKICYYRAVNNAEGGETISVESISLQSTASIVVGKSITLEVSFTPSNATNKNVTWESDDTGIATVTNGVVKGISEGTATITATSEDGNKTAECIVTVTPAPEGTTFKLVTDATTLNAGDRIIIVATESDFALGSKQNSNNRDAVAITKEENNITITDEDNVEIITLGGSVGKWTLNVSDGYLYAVNNNNYLRTIATANDASYWTISIEATEASIKNNSVTAYYIMKNTNSALFSCYKGTQSSVQIYKEVTSTTDLPTLLSPTHSTIYTSNGTLFVNTEVGSLIEVYNILGQKLVSKNAQSNENTIRGLKTGQILIVKANNKVVKVKL